MGRVFCVFIHVIFWKLWYHSIKIISAVNARVELWVVLLWVFWSNITVNVFIFNIFLSIQHGKFRRSFVWDEQSCSCWKGRFSYVDSGPSLGDWVRCGPHVISIWYAGRLWGDLPLLAAQEIVITLTSSKTSDVKACPKTQVFNGVVLHLHF